jgi:hypothetical protein
MNHQIQMRFRGFKSIVIFDIDNCIADDHWRQPLIDWDLSGDLRYARYNDAMDKDKLCNGEIFKLFMELGHTPVFFSGRPEAYRGKTALWLADNLSYTQNLFLRPNGTKGLTPRALKERMLRNIEEECIARDIEVVAAFDDIPAVVEMYRELRIPAAVLAIHSDLSGAYQPGDLK